MVDDGVDGLLTELNMEKMAAAIVRVMEDDALYAQLQHHALQKAEAMSARSMALQLEDVYLRLNKGRTYRSRRLLNVSNWFSN